MDEFPLPPSHPTSSPGQTRARPVRSAGAVAGSGGSLTAAAQTAWAAAEPAPSVPPASPATVEPLAPAAREQALQALSPRAANVAAQASYHLRVGLRGGQRETTVHLDPPGLGRLRISMRGEGPRMTAVLRAELPEVESLLREGADAIRDRLNRQGLSIERVIVESTTGRTGAPAPVTDQSKWAGSLPSYDNAADDPRRPGQEGPARDPHPRQGRAQDQQDASRDQERSGGAGRGLRRSALDLTA